MTGLCDAASGAVTGAITGAITSPFCFVVGTLVLTAEGFIPIEAVSAGDIVWAEDPESGEQSLSSVVQTFENETEALVHVTVEGNTITSTPHHPFYSPVKGWTDALDLRAGDILVRSNGEYVIVEQVQHEILENPVKVYNFEVQDYHTYYVGCREVLVHNMCIDNYFQYLDDESPRTSRIGKQKGNTPRNNQNQNNQVKNVVKELGLNKSQRRELHSLVTGQGYGYKEMLDIAKDLFGKM